MKTKAKSIKSSGNVFLDIGVEDAELHLLKADLAIAILNIIDDKKLTQQKAAEILWVEKPEISKLKHGNLSRFRVERLLGFLNKLGRSVDIHIKKARSVNPTQTVRYKRAA
jgi:predicted XRE-type DNA-binding protein